MNLKTITTVFGAVLLLVGILGFVPGITTNNLLLGIFQVDALHNVVHILTGAAALTIAMTAPAYTRLYYQVFGVVYGLVTLLGFLTGQGLAFLLPVNLADNLLHVAITAFALYFGFVHKEPKAVKADA